MTRRFMTLAAGIIISGSTLLAADQPTIDMAICLDTSNSMDGLIDAAKQKLWAVVSDLGTAKPSPRLRVALYQYGNDGLSSENGWIQQLCPLTDDLDTVYGKLFALKTNGGTEYVARVVSAATDQLDWDKDPQSLHMIVVAGNEPATQDPKVKLEAACKGAAEHGIIVNTIFCGNEQEGRNTGWADAARFADGRYAAIDQNGGTVVIQTPFDNELSSLGTKLNSTYVAYGVQGEAGAANQKTQDANAVSLSAPAAAVRSVVKAAPQYSNASWDLVDAQKQSKVDAAKLPQAELPKEMQAMTPEQRVQFIDQKAKERDELKGRIAELSSKRELYVKDEMKRQGLNDKSAFDAALRQAVREQAARKQIDIAQ